MKKNNLMLYLACLGVMVSGCTLDRACKDQELKCETDPTTQEGIRYTCIDGIWLNAESGNSCQNAETWGVCLNGAKKCEDGGMKTCVNGLWSDSDNACGTKGCKSISECADCSDSEVMCDKKTNRFRPCVNGSWLSIDFECPSKACNETGTACTEKPDCSDAEVECYDGVLKTCQNGKWREERCPNSTSCKPDNSGCSECNDDETSCRDGKYKVCVNGGWVEAKACTCFDDKTCAECTAGQTECDSPRSFRTCSQDNTWGSSETCGDNFCTFNGQKAVCNATPPSCEDKEKMCFGSSLYVCSSNQWVFSAMCESGCDTKTAECYACLDGKTRCSDGKLQTCVNHTWQDTSNCKGGTCIDEAACANCVVGTTCSDDNAFIGIVTSCADGVSQTQTKCEKQSCSVNAEGTVGCGECLNGTQKCENDKNNVGVPMFCVNGLWSYGGACSGESSCKDSQSCGECRDGARRCQGKSESVCVNGIWQPETPCVNGCNANGTACIPSDVCTNGKEKCENGVIYTCINNAWGNEKSCTGGVSCMDSTVCGDCINGDTQCELGILRVCEQGTWSEGTPCENKAKCENDKKCATCTEGGTKCEDGKSYTCKNGAWEAGICKDNASCLNSSSCGFCQNGSKKCDGSVLKTCENGDWNAGIKCDLCQGSACVNCSGPIIVKSIEDGESVPCVNGDITVSSSVSDLIFPKLSSVTGSIDASKALTLKSVGLPSLSNVDGRFELIAPELIKLEMPSIETMGSFSLNSTLISELNLLTLKKVAKDIEIVNNSKLMIGVLGMVSAYDIKVTNNISLQYLHFPSLEHVNRAQIINNPNLSQLELSMLSGEIDELIIEENGMSEINMDDVNIIRKLVISKNKRLGFISFYQIRKIVSLEITDNPMLSCEDICKLYRVADNKTVLNNRESYCKC